MTAPRSETDYALCGWRVRSALQLPEVAKWQGDERPVDVTIRFGAAPPLADPIRLAGGRVEIARDGVCRLSVAGVAAYQVIAGREVIIERAGASPGDADTDEAGLLTLRGWLLGAVVGILCHQRGRFPLHAAAIRVGAGAIALVGRSGAGKSSLAAALACRGHGVLADDVCAITVDAGDGPQLSPAFPRLKLCDDTIRALSIAAGCAPCDAAGKRPFHFSPIRAFDPSPVGLSGIYLLDRLAALDGDIQHLSRADAATCLVDEIYRRPIGYRLGRQAALMSDALHIAARVPVFRCRIPPDLSRLTVAAAIVEEHALTL